MKEFTGKRILVKTSHHIPTYVELKVLETSPTGDFIKIQFIGGGIEWYSQAQFEMSYYLVEVLTDAPVTRIKRARTSGKIV